MGKVKDEGVFDQFRRFTRNVSEYIFGERHDDPGMNWTTADGEKLFIPAMKTDHLQNCVRLMVRHAVCRWLGVMIQPEENYIASHLDNLGNFDADDGPPGIENIDLRPPTWHDLLDRRTRNMIKELEERSHGIDYLKYGEDSLEKVRRYLTKSLAHLPFTMKHLLGGV